MTPAQQRAWRELWSRYGIAADDAAALATAFTGPGRRILEIGFGNGEGLVEQATADPEAVYIGVEVHEPGIGHCLLEAEHRGLDNLRLIHGDAMEVLGHLPAASVDRVNLYFPDPWPKKRHHKRRLVAPRFLDRVARVLVPGGTLHTATDWSDYADQIDEVVGADQRFELIQRREHGGDRPLERPGTKFEERGRKLGHRISDRIWRRRRGAATS